MSVSKPKKPSPAQLDVLRKLATEKNARISIRRWPENHPHLPNVLGFCRLLWMTEYAQKGCDIQPKSFEAMERAGWIAPTTEKTYSKHVSYAPDREDYSQHFGITDTGRVAIGLPPKNTETTTPKETPTTDA